MRARLSPTALSALTACLLLPGCATTVVESHPATAKAGQSGLVYALPKAQVQLLAQRKLVDADEVAAAKKDAAELAAGAVAAKARATEAALVLKDATDTHAAAVANAKATSEAREELQRRADIAQAVLDVMKARLGVADTQAEAASKRAAAVIGEMGHCTETANLTLLPNAPDPEARFLATHAQSAWRDDQLTIAVSPSGLLNTSSAVSTDQTGTVILSAVQAFAAARVPTSGSALRLFSRIPGMREADPSPDACQPYKSTLVFDPTRAAEVQDATDKLKGFGAGIGLCVEGLGKTRDTAATEGPVPGYAYRASRPVRVTLSGSTKGPTLNCAAAPNTEAASLVAHVPDATTLFVTPVQGAPFTKVSNRHTFKDGMLVEVAVDKPSMAAAIASIPVEILKALVSIPASMIKLRVDYETQSASLVNSQANVLKAQVDLLNAQKALEDRLAQPAPGP